MLMHNEQTSNSIFASVLDIQLFSHKASSSSNVAEYVRFRGIVAFDGLRKISFSGTIVSSLSVKLNTGNSTESKCAKDDSLLETESLRMIPSRKLTPDATLLEEFSLCP